MCTFRRIKVSRLVRTLYIKTLNHIKSLRKFRALDCSKICVFFNKHHTTNRYIALFTNYLDETQINFIRTWCMFSIRSLRFQNHTLTPDNYHDYTGTNVQRAWEYVLTLPNGTLRHSRFERWNVCLHHRPGEKHILRCYISFTVPSSFPSPNLTIYQSSRRQYVMGNTAYTYHSSQQQALRTVIYNRT